MAFEQRSGAIDSAWMASEDEAGILAECSQRLCSSVEDGPVAHHLTATHEQGHAAGAPAIAHHRDQSPAVAQLGEQRFGPFGNCRIHEDGIEPLRNAENRQSKRLVDNGDVGHAGPRRGSRGLSPASADRGSTNADASAGCVRRLPLRTGPAPAMIRMRLAFAAEFQILHMPGKDQSGGQEVARISPSSPRGR